MTLPHICLIGQFIVDVTLPSRSIPYKLRAGGIMHAARALWAIGCPYSLCYCAPDYLTSHIEENAEKYGAAKCQRFGVVSGCPNVMLIGEPREIGDQGYEFLLRDIQKCMTDAEAINSCMENPVPTDVLLFPGGFDLHAVLAALTLSTANVYADANFEPHSPATFGILGRPFETLIYSTSSRHFVERYSGSFDSIKTELLGKYAKSILLKENRGGSRFIRENSLVSTAAQSRIIQHSVGVGDCFDAVFIALRHNESEAAALAYASCIAAEYASTTYPDEFRDNAQAWLNIPAEEIAELGGVVLPWESRPSINIYIAAPDFDHVDRRPIDTVAASLKYHNFTPRLPVREHGQMGQNPTQERRQALCDADMRLLGDCQVLVAVMLYDDPGTLIEIGIAVERGIPVIVYDPGSRADNLMLTQLPFLVSSDLDQVISAVFDCASRLSRQ